MERFNPETASSEERSRVGFLEGRPELFETKFFGLELRDGEKPHSDDDPTLLVLGRDPGGMNSLIPVLRELDDTHSRTYALVDGRAEEAMRKHFRIDDLTPQESIFASNEQLENPSAILAAVSVSGGIERYAAGTYPEAPMILVEDYYRASFEYLRWVREYGMRPPTEICVMDDAARKLLVQEFPEFADAIRVTGSPAFDRFANEPTSEIAARVRAQLDISSEVPLVSFMSALHDAEEMPHLAEALSQLDRDIAVAVRKHPRDNTPLEQYLDIFRRGKLRSIESSDYTTDEIGAASDLVVTSWSTEGLNAIYRRKPSLHYIDATLPNIPPNVETPVPQERLGASLGATSREQLPDLLHAALDPTSTVRRILEENMAKWYPVDGKNAQRVGDVVRRHL